MLTEKVAELVGPVMDTFSDNIQIAFIFGSVATGYDDNTEEKQVVAIGDVDADKLTAAVATATTDVTEGVKTSVFNREQFIADFLSGKLFIRKSANAPKTFFIGEDGDLWDLYYSA